jgi:hypothetical protein
MAQRKPAHHIRLGRIRAAIWQNENGEDRSWFNVTVTRTYNDDNEWKDTHSFRRDDLPVVAKVLDMAYAWIWDRQAAPSSDEADE